VSDDLERLADELDRRADQHAIRANEAENSTSSLLADIRADAFGDAAAIAREMAHDSDEANGGEEA